MSELFREFMLVVSFVSVPTLFVVVWVLFGRVKHLAKRCNDLERWIPLPKKDDNVIAQEDVVEYYYASPRAMTLKTKVLVPRGTRGTVEAGWLLESYARREGQLPWEVLIKWKPEGKESFELRHRSDEPIGIIPSR